MHSLPLSLSLLLAAAGAEPPPQSCTGPFDRDRVLTCALSQSLEVRQARQELAALSGQRIAAGALLPSMPWLSATAASRRHSDRERAAGDAGGTAFNWTTTLSQEVDLSGQRGLRVDAANAASNAQRRRIAVGEQEVCAASLSAYYTLLAAREAVGLSQGIARVANGLRRLAEGRGVEGLVSPMDTTVAKAEAARLSLLNLAAQRQERSAKAQLAVLLGLSPSSELPLEGTLWIESAQEPINEEELSTRAVALRGEVEAAGWERQVTVQRLQLMRRERVPHVTFSVFAQRDGFNERVLGGGISLPLPLFSPLWPSRTGAVAEAQAKLELSETETLAVRRRVRLEVAQALAEDLSRQEGLRALPRETVKEARERLELLSEALAGGQLTLREALLSQRSLIELLQTDLEVRLARALARVELLRAAGIPLYPFKGALR